MPIRALFLANGVVLLFLGLALIQGYNGINDGGLVNKMQEQGIIPATR